MPFCDGERASQAGFVRQYAPSVFDRCGWLFRVSEVGPSGVRAGALRWADPHGALQLTDGADGSDRVLLRFFDLAGAWISRTERSIHAFPLVSGLSPHTFDHFVMDVVLPRVIAESGDLVLHGALVAQGMDGACLLGRSGLGKSTLAAALRNAGWTFFGDDALELGADGEEITARATYPSLRLFPDSLRQIYPDPPTCLSPVADYLNKFRMDPGGAVPAGEASRLRAVFVLGEDDGSGDVTVQPLAASKLCMALVAHSFALDPSDPASAHRRLSFASAVTAAVPGFALNYPRDYARLPEVIDRVRAVLEHVLADIKGRVAIPSRTVAD